MRLMGTKLHMTSAFHPQSDGQTEAANRVIVVYLRCFTRNRPRQWLRWLPWVEYTYNTAYQTSLRDTPFRVVYGCDPPSIRSYEPGETRVAAVAQDMEAHETFLADVRYRLEHRCPRSSTTTGNISRSLIRWAIGHFFNSGSEPRPPYPGRPRGS
jgi:hypothetical protein